MAHTFQAEAFFAWLTSQAGRGEPGSVRLLAGDVREAIRKYGPIQGPMTADGFKQSIVAAAIAGGEADPEDLAAIGAAAWACADTWARIHVPQP